jgi:hypothetical protein
MEDTFRNSLHAPIVQPRPVSILAPSKVLTDEVYRGNALASVHSTSVLDNSHNTYDR